MDKAECEPRRPPSWVSPAVCFVADCCWDWRTGRVGCESRRILNYLTDHHFADSLVLCTEMVECENHHRLICGHSTVIFDDQTGERLQKGRNKRGRSKNFACRQTELNSQKWTKFIAAFRESAVQTIHYLQLCLIGILCVKLISKI